MNTAILWYKLAAQKGFPAAEYQLGLVFAYASTVKKDPTLAFEWFLKAAEKGHAQAHLEVATCLQKGKGTIPHLEDAFAWL
ncbi:MAG: sel1 repeat family protein [Verrucomicrobia bacterium]|nr:sel1 repeat family protein [Verrucomicrobiota bacterium]